ncbi:hypothetical protein [Rhizobium sullae]|uniref:hypothetical protein n=1 Tax=Rhizobium sullae TaxID=50338 RepID=UPI000B353D1E|nr:hypothetical protein [Rhizobium sullae]
MEKRSIAVAYAVPLILMAIVLASSYALGDGPSVIFRKVLFAPVFLLAIKGLRTFFPQHLDRTRSFSTQAEFQLLNALLLSAFLISVGPYESLRIIPLICAFAGMAILIAGWNLAFFWRDRGRAQD